MAVANIEPGQPFVTRITPTQWIKKNLFSTWYNYILSALSLYLVYWAASNLITWVFEQAQWHLEPAIELIFRL